MSNTNDFAPSSDFLKIIPDLWAGRKIVVISVVAAVVLAGILSILMPETFESEAGLLLMPPPFKESKDEMTSLIPKVLSVPDYEIMLKSDGVLMEAVKKVREEAAGPKKDIWTEDDLEGLLELSSIRGRMFVSTEVTEKNVTSMKFSPVIRLKARAGTPEQAQHLAQAWAQVSEELAVSLYKKGKSGLTDFMRASFDDTRTMLTDLNREIRDVEIEWNDELENARVLKTHARYLDYHEKIMDTEMKIAATQKEIAVLEENFAKQTEKITLWKSPPMEAVFLGDKPSKGSAPRDAGYEEEILSPTYVELEQKLTLKRSELSGLLEFNQQMRDNVEDLETELQDLRREAAVRTFDRKLLDIQVTPLQNAYDTLSIKLQQAKIAETEQSNLADIKIISDPALPDRKSFPPRSLIVISAAVLAGLGSCAFIIARGLLKRAGLDFSA